MPLKNSPNRLLGPGLYPRAGEETDKNSVPHSSYSLGYVSQLSVNKACEDSTDISENVLSLEMMLYMLPRKYVRRKLQKLNLIFLFCLQHLEKLF